MAPECYSRPATKAADIYALGIVMNEFATGNHPYKDKELADPQLYTVLETRPVSYTHLTLPTIA